MNPIHSPNFLRRDGSRDSESAIEAGHDARTAAFRAFLKQVSQTISSARLRDAVQG